ncbi:MAG: protein kinase [Planctomycetes bacterium]|nr:protein kinase [Planctomycetota bacterium]
MSHIDTAEAKSNIAEIVERGYLNEAQAREALRNYLNVGPKEPLPMFLHRLGILDRAQLLELGFAPPRGATTMLVPSKLGKVYSGYKVTLRLGRGGMGMIYLADRVGADEDEDQVVLKFLSPGQSVKETTRRRFRLEGEVLKRLSNHPNVVTVIDVCVEEDSAQEPYIVMEYVRGLSLERMLAERWSLPPEEATRYARDVALGLEAVHEEGIVHRDIKPGNILVTEDSDEVRIVDFGLAKDLGADMGLTQPGQLLGTPTYMAPEQWRGRPIDKRCDLYALGATLYHLLVGEPPFSGSTRKDVARLILEGTFTPPRQIEPAISPDLQRVVLQLMATDRRHRYPDAGAAARDLQRVLDGEPVEVPRLIDDAGHTEYELLGRSSFSIGRDPECEVALSHPTVSRKHAVIERDGPRFVIRDLGSTYGTFVGGLRVTARQVYEGDVVLVGKVELRFVGGAVAPEAALTRTRIEAATPIVNALREAADGHAILTLLEDLAPDPPQLDRVRDLQPVLGPLTADVLAEVGATLDERRERAIERLQAATGETFTSADDWLAWWLREHERCVPQVVIRQPEPRARLRVVEGEPQQLAVPVGTGEAFTMGRDEECALPLSNRSVSRLHATLHRLHERFFLSDEGSSFGSQVNGAKLTHAFVSPGDQIRLGQVGLFFELDAQDLPRGGLNTYLVDTETYLTLERMGSPSVSTALVYFLHEVERLDWIEAELARLGLSEVPDLALRVRRAYEQRAERAKALLPTLLGCTTPQECRQTLAEKRTKLPPQVLPIGWRVHR